MDSAGREQSPILVNDPVKFRNVAYLLNGPGVWNEERVRSNFCEEDAETILNIPIPSQSKDDEIIWNHRKMVFSAFEVLII